MLGYTLEKQKMSRNSLGGNYGHIYVTFYASDSFSDRLHFRRLFSVSWQCDDNINDVDNYFYGQTFDGLNNDYQMLKECIKILTKIEKADQDRVSADSFIEWLQDQKRIKRLVHDQRLNGDLVLAETYVDTINLSPFKMMVSGKYYMDVLAFSAYEAENKCLKEFAKQGQTHLLKKWDSVTFEEKSYVKDTIFLTVEEWLVIE